MRVFTSAPVVKRYDIFTLESADGICIVVKGFINKSRTLENGFSSEVFSHFMFGFPPCWEAYNEKCLGKDFTIATGSATFPDFNKAASVPKFAAVAGISNSIPTTTPSKHSENLTERVTTNASIGLDSPNQSAECNNIDKTNKCTLENLPPSISCDTNTISSLENNLAFRAEPSSYNATESSERLANSRNSVEGNERTVRKSKTKEPASFESIITTNAALEESPVPKNSVYNHSPSNMSPVVSRENSSVELMAIFSSPKTSEKQKENDNNEDVLDRGIKSCSNDSLPHDSEAIVRCTGEKSNGVERSNFLSFGLEVRHRDSLSTSPTSGDPNAPDFSNCVGDSMTQPVVHSATNINSVTPSKVDMNAVNTTPSNSGSQKTRYWLRNLKGNQEKNSGFRGSVKQKSEQLTSEASEGLDGEKLKWYGLRNLKSNRKEHSSIKLKGKS